MQSDLILTKSWLFWWRKEHTDSTTDVALILHDPGYKPCFTTLLPNFFPFRALILVQAYLLNSYLLHMRYFRINIFYFIGCVLLPCVLRSETFEIYIAQTNISYCCCCCVSKIASVSRKWSKQAKQFVIAQLRHLELAYSTQCPKEVWTSPKKHSRRWRQVNQEITSRWIEKALKMHPGDPTAKNWPIRIISPQEKSASLNLFFLTRTKTRQA